MRTPSHPAPTKELAKTCDTCGRPSSRAGLFPREIAYTALLPEPCRSDCRAWPWGWGKRERCDCERSYLFGSCEKPESFTEGGTEGCFSQLKRTTLTTLLAARPSAQGDRRSSKSNELPRPADAPLHLAHQSQLRLGLAVYEAHRATRSRDLFAAFV